MDAREDILLSVEDLRVSFRNEEGRTDVLRGLSYCLPKGKILAVVGESGCGKTVHALSLLKLLPSGGEIISGKALYKGRDVLSLSPQELRKLRGAEISMIFQDPMTSLNPILTVGEQLTETILAHKKCTRLQAKARAVRLLKKVGIENPRKRLNEYPFQFSGGQRQRIMIAMALCLNPGLLIADEPTTALDVTIQAQILKLIKDLQAQSSMSAVFITHNLAIVADIADEVLVLYGGYCVEQARAEELFARPLHPYTWGLLHSLVSLKRKEERLPAIEGYPPAPGTPKEGCPFAPRCPRVQEKCRTQLPPLSESNGRRVRCWLQEKA